MADGTRPDTELMWARAGLRLSRGARGAGSEYGRPAPWADRNCRMRGRWDMRSRARGGQWPDDSGSRSDERFGTDGGRCSGCIASNPATS